MKVTKNSIIGDVLDYDQGTGRFFFEIGMHCLGCPASRGESIEDACAVHGTDADELVAKLNAYLADQYHDQAGDQCMISHVNSA